MVRTYWWQSDVQILSSRTSSPIEHDNPIEAVKQDLEAVKQDERSVESMEPLSESTPNHIHFLLETESITDDLEDSLLRIRQRNCSLSGSEGENIGSIIDERGRNLEVSESKRESLRGTSRSKSRTPLKIRDNISLLFGWDKSDSEYGLESEEIGPEISEIPESPIDLSRISLQEQDTNTQIFKYHKPCSRLAILDSNQYYAFKYEMSLLKSKINDFPLYFQWYVWVSEGKTTEIQYVLENNIDVKVAFKALKKLDECKISVFQKKSIPKRKHVGNIDSITVDFKVDHQLAFDVFKQMVKVVVDGSLYKPSIELVVCGVKLQKRSSYSIVSLWFFPPKTKFNSEDVFDPDLVRSFIDQVRDHLPGYCQEVIPSAMVVENRGIVLKRVYDL